MLKNISQLKIDKTRFVSSSLVATILIIILLRPNFASSLDRGYDFFIFLIVTIFFIFNKMKIIKSGFFWIKANLFIFLCMALSYANGVFDGYSYISRDFFEFYRPIFNILLFVFGTYLSIHYKNSFLKIIIFVIVIQLIFIVFQMLNPFNFIDSIVGLIYNMEKVSSHLLRFTGTYANPNTLALVVNVLFFYVFYYFYYKNNKISMLSLIFITHMIIVFLTSSRTALIICIFLYGIIFFSNKKTYFNIYTYILGITFTLVIFIFLNDILFYLANFKYIYELITTSNILEIRSIQLRLEHYESMFALIKENSLLGIGANKDLLRVGDNDYLFTLTQYGIIGFFLKYGLYIYLYFRLNKLSKLNYLSEEFWIIQGTKISIVLVFFAGITLESFYNYSILSIILINAGFCISLISKYNIKEKEKNDINNNAII